MKQGKGFAKRVTKENLTDFAPLLKKQPDSSSDTSSSVEATSPGPVDQELAAAEDKFDGKPIKSDYNHKPPKLAAPKPKKTSTSSTASPSATTTPPASATGPLTKGPLLWEKRLTSTDAQKVTGNPTGCVKLAQAKFLDPATGLKINWKVYFRHTAFAGLTWAPTGRIHAEEEADIIFEVSISGTNLGQRKLKVIHKPSGEAGQSNVPTQLHWGQLRPEVMASDFTDNLLRIYAPAPGTNSPYFLELTT